MRLTEIISYLKAFPKNAKVLITGDHKCDAFTPINRVFIGEAYDIGLYYDEAEEYNFGTKPFSIGQLLDKLIEAEKKTHNCEVDYRIEALSEEEDDYTGNRCTYEVDSMEYSRETNTVLIWREALNYTEARERIEQLKAKFEFYTELIQEFNDKLDEINKQLPELYKIR